MLHQLQMIKYSRGVSVTSSEVDLLSGAEAGKVKNGKTAVYSSSGELKATNVSTATLSADTSVILEMSASTMVHFWFWRCIPFSDNNLTTTGNITGNNVIVNGNLTVNGNNATVSSENL